MLHTSTVSQPALELLNKLMKLPALNEFTLAGGTALALQIGHRISYDLDLFCNCTMSNDEILGEIQDVGNIQLLSQSNHVLILNINNIKVDFVKYRYPFIAPKIIESNYRLASIKDIAAMKIAAITGRGTKRDFVDLFFLLQQFDLEEILSFYTLKYNDSNVLLALRSLTYFDDAELQPDVVFVNEKTIWQKMKDEITISVSKYLNKL